MAKIKFGAIAADARGKVDGIVYSRNQYGAYVRNKVTPVNPGSSPQTVARARFKGSTTQWNNITEAKRQAWRDFASTHPITDVFGQSKILSGIAMFARINEVIKNAGGTILTSPPVDQDVTGMLTFAAEYDIGPGDTEINFTATPLEADQKLYIWATPPMSTAKQYFEHLLKFIGVSAAAETSPFDFESLYTARYTAPQEGQYIGLKACVVNTINGARSAYMTVRLTVVDTTV